jgi:FAD/FMN-containing dehydrogenase
MVGPLSRSEFVALAGMAGAASLRAPFALGGRPQDADFLVLPGSKRYEAMRARYNATIDRRPAAIAPCSEVGHVVRAVRYATAHQLPIAIKSGGHSFEGFSTNDQGLVVDLSAMNRVRWLDKQTIAVEPGCTLSMLNDELLPKGRLLPAGSCGSVGIAGLTLGGGYGFFSREFGLTCDSLEALTLVDAEGRVRSTKDDEELLWACRGGGNGSFGVVTELVFRTHKAPPLITRHRFRARDLDAARALRLMQLWFDETAQLPDNHFSAFVLNHDTVLVLLFGSGDGGKAVSRFVQTMSSTCDETQTGKPQPIAAALRAHYGQKGPVAFKNASAGLYRNFADLRAAAPEAIAMVLGQQGMIFQVNTLGGEVLNAAAAGASAFPHRERPYLGELQAYWEQPAQRQRLLAAFPKVQNILRKHGVTAHYANYPDLAFTDWARAYYGDSYERLRAVKRRYDPQNFFRHPQSIQA